MWLSRLVGALVIGSLVSVPAQAQISTFDSGGKVYVTYPANFYERGGLIGITYTQQLYRKDGVGCFSVISVDSNSSFSALRPGDCIYGVGNMSFRDDRDLQAIIGNYPAGTEVILYYYSAANGWASYWVRGYLKPRQVAAPAVARNTTSAYQATQQLNRSIEAIILQDEPSWWSTYDRGSVNNAHIRSVSSDGRTVVARAYYSYNRGTRDWIDVRTVDGRVSCIEYGTEISSCRAINSSGTGGVLLAAVGIAVIALVASSGGSGNSNPGSSGQRAQSSDPGDYGPPRSTPAPQQPQEQPRTYGLYGNCPAPGAGYGC